MRIGLAAAAVLAALTAAFAVPARAHVSAAAPGPRCGGTLWKLMTLSDAAKKSVKWAPSATSIPNIAKVPAPAKVTTARNNMFVQHVWSLDPVIIERYRMASNGEIVLELFDIPSGTYMNAYMPAPDCLPAGARARGQLIRTRDSFMSQCPAVTTDWQMLGATADVSGVGFWNPVKTTLGALKSGAELRPLVTLNIRQGCGHF